MSHFAFSQNFAFFSKNSAFFFAKMQKKNFVKCENFVKKELLEFSALIAQYLKFYCVI